MANLLDFLAYETDNCQWKGKTAKTSSDDCSKKTTKLKINFDVCQTMANVKYEVSAKYDPCNKIK